MAGRDISVTHEALGAVRVMRTGGCMGEVVGMAASLCKKHDAQPRAVYERHLSELQNLMGVGVGKNPCTKSEYPPPRPKTAFPPVVSVPAWLTKAGSNWTTAAISVPGGSKEGCSPALINDGQADVAPTTAAGSAAPKCRTQSNSPGRSR